MKSGAAFFVGPRSSGRVRRAGARPGAANYAAVIQDQKRSGIAKLAVVDASAKRAYNFIDTANSQSGPALFDVNATTYQHRGWPCVAEVCSRYATAREMNGRLPVPRVCGCLGHNGDQSALEKSRFETVVSIDTCGSKRQHCKGSDRVAVIYERESCIPEDSDPPEDKPGQCPQADEKDIV